MVWYSHLFQNCPQLVVIHIVKGFGIVNKAEIDIFLELSCFFHDPADAGNLISGSSAFSKTSLNIWKFMVHLLLKPGLENFEHYFTSVWDECNLCGSLSILWHCLFLGLEWKLTFVILRTNQKSIANFVRYILNKGFKMHLRLLFWKYIQWNKHSKI